MENQKKQPLAPEDDESDSSSSSNESESKQAAHIKALGGVTTLEFQAKVKENVDLKEEGDQLKNNLKTVNNQVITLEDKVK